VALAAATACTTAVGEAASGERFRLALGQLQSTAAALEEFRLQLVKVADADGDPLFLGSTIRRRVGGVRIKSCAESGDARKVPVCHSYLPVCPTVSHVLPAAGSLPQAAIGNG